MPDHFEVMAGRLLTETTLQSAVDEAYLVHSTITTAREAAVPEPRPRSGVLAECRICQDEEDEEDLETPCSCRGSLKVKFLLPVLVTHQFQQFFWDGVSPIWNMLDCTFKKRVTPN
jgi:hypothetical protein